MKKIMTLLAVLFVGSSAFAATSALRPQEALSLLLKSAASVTLKTEDVYEVPFNSLVGLLGHVLWTDGNEVIRTNASCNIENKEEVCSVSFHKEDADEKVYDEETSYILLFKVDRSSGKPVIKNNTVTLLIAG